MHPHPARSRGTAPASFARLLLPVAVGLLAANCAGKPREAARAGSDLDPRYGVRASPRVVADGEPVPKGGGREMVGKPYTVGGRTYVPREDRSYAREGLASWYGSAFHGRLTANGEVFDQESVAAAHPTLPLPSYARVTNLRNGRSLIVRVNDRGPYHENRLIDVSQRAAEALDFRRVGTTQVRVEYVGRASTRGSDDARLMATLRTDGRAAPFRGMTAPTLVAAAEPRPAPLTPRPVETPASPRAPVPAPVSAPLPLQVAQARPAQAQPMRVHAAATHADRARAAPVGLAQAHAAQTQTRMAEPRMARTRVARAEPAAEERIWVARAASRAGARPSGSVTPVPPSRPMSVAAAGRPGAAPGAGRPASAKGGPVALSYAAVETARASAR